MGVHLTAPPDGLWAFLFELFSYYPDITANYCVINQAPGHLHPCIICTYCTLSSLTLNNAPKLW